MKSTLMTHAVVGYPDLATTEKIILALVHGGASIIELQIPFSDPLGDGTTIREANSIALANHVKVEDVFSLVKRLRHQHKLTVPIYLMTYVNIPFTRGFEKFCANTRESGANGLIIPDYNPNLELHEHLIEITKKNKLVFVPCLGSHSSDATIRQAKEIADDFIYCFSRQGLTGSSPADFSYLQEFLKKIKRLTGRRIAVGFGVSNRKHITQLEGVADIIVVGSAFIKAFQENGLMGIKKKINELFTDPNF